MSNEKIKDNLEYVERIRKTLPIEFGRAEALDLEKLNLLNKIDISLNVIVASIDNLAGKLGGSL